MRRQPAVVYQGIMCICLHVAVAVMNELIDVY